MSSIVTFYSFKGGVGRSMALASIAVLLAQQGKKVLIVDWDLGAPGLHRYFSGRYPDGANAEGVCQLLSSSYAAEDPVARAREWSSYVVPVEIPGVSGAGGLELLPAGSDDREFVRHLASVDWDVFFAERNGGEVVEALRSGWRDSYDLLLIDSRTGYTDSGGICTIQLPDVLVAVFTANHQSFDGVRQAIRRAQAGRQALSYDRMPLTVLPLPSRWDGREEVEESTRWLKRVSADMSQYYDSWLPEGTNYREIVERTKVPHIALFSFGEKLPVLTHSRTDPEGVGFVFNTVAALLAENFRNADKVR